MSARDLMLPDRAFIETLNRLQNQLISIQRRIRFPGATMVVEVAGPVAMVNDPSFGSIASLDLYRGRWIISASFTATIQGGGGDVGNSAATRFSVNGVFTQPVSREGSAGATLKIVVTNYWTVSLESDSVLHLEAHAEGNAVGTSNASDIIIMAGPG